MWQTLMRLATQQPGHIFNLTSVELVVKNPPPNAGDMGDVGWGIPWRREWQPTPVSLPGEPHGQGSLVSYSPWGCKELDTINHEHQLYLVDVRWAISEIGPIGVISREIGNLK